VWFWSAALAGFQIIIFIMLWFVQRRQNRLRRESELKLRLLEKSLRTKQRGGKILKLLINVTGNGKKEPPTFH
jgi:hypothetical protein